MSKKLTEEEIHAICSIASHRTLVYVEKMLEKKLGKDHPKHTASYLAVTHWIHMDALKRCMHEGHNVMDLLDSILQQTKEECESYHKQYIKNRGKNPWLSLVN